MAWMPVFQIGLWNAWIPTLFILLHPVIMTLVNKAVGSGDLFQKMGGTAAEEEMKKSIPVPTILLAALFLFSIFLPLQPATVWLYTGLAIYLAGAGMFLTAMLTAAKTPSGQLFARGMYRYSRHPLYLSFLFMFIGVSLAAASWLYLLFSMGWMVFPLSQVASEEQECHRVFGVDYLEYVRKTPKWIGIPRS